MSKKQDKSRRPLLSAEEQAVCARTTAIREAYGATQETLAKLLGVAKSTVGHWESDSLIPTKQLIAFVRLTNADVSYLLFGVPAFTVANTSQGVATSGEEESIEGAPKRVRNILGRKINDGLKVGAGSAHKHRSKPKK